MLALIAVLMFAQVAPPIPGIQPSPEVRLKDSYAPIDLAQGPVFQSFMNGFRGPFIKSFADSSRGLMPTERCITEAGSITFNVVVEYHFGDLTISEVRELLSCECDKRLLKLVNYDETLRKKLNNELRAFAIKASDNKAAYVVGGKQ